MATPTVNSSINFNRNADGGMNYSIAQNNESRVDRRKFSGHYQHEERQSIGSSSVPKLGGGLKKTAATIEAATNSR